jgi:hypothetical protein
MIFIRASSTFFLRIGLGRGGPWGRVMLRIQHCLESVLTDGGEVVSLMGRPLPYTPET